MKVEYSGGGTRKEQVDWAWSGFGGRRARKERGDWAQSGLSGMRPRWVAKRRGRRRRNLPILG